MQVEKASSLHYTTNTTQLPTHFIYVSGPDGGSTIYAVEEIISLLQKICEAQVLREIVCSCIMGIIPNTEVVNTPKLGMLFLFPHSNWLQKFSLMIAMLIPLFYD